MRFRETKGRWPLLKPSARPPWRAESASESESRPSHGPDVKSAVRETPTAVSV